ncbi:MAG: hypothetical protein RLO81_00910 [Fulvivirga sp.]|uniref:hypothetical protein n=1 Tax=Fulvivirga sp. TaxID=1931237 RepID=UPI0032EBEE01
MAVGDSGRIVIEVDPQFKKKFRKALALKEITLKDWFVKQAEEFIENNHQLKIFEK